MLHLWFLLSKGSRLYELSKFAREFVVLDFDEKAVPFLCGVGVAKDAFLVSSSLALGFSLAAMASLA